MYFQFFVYAITDAYFFVFVANGGLVFVIFVQ